MSRWRSIFEVARRDFVQRAQSRIFLVATLAVMAAIFGGVPLLAQVLEGPSAIPVGMVTPFAVEFEAALDFAADGAGVDLEVESYSSRELGEVALDAGEVEALVDGREVVYRQQASGTLQAIFVAAFGFADRQIASVELGLAPDELAALLAPEPPEVVTLSEPDPDAEARSAAAYVGVLLLFISIVMFGQFVLLGVLEEKAGRVAEVVLSRVRPVELLAGKVIGIGLLGLVQLILIGGSLVAILNVIDLADLPDLGEMGLGILLSVVMWFLLGYSLYSVLFAAAGSLVSRQEDVQSVSWIPIVAILPGYFIALVATADPETTLVEVASMLPITAPMVMLVRSAALEVPPWQFGVAIASTVVSTIVLIRIAARIYRGGILRSGRTKIREAWRQAGL